MTFEDFWLDLIPVGDGLQVSLHDSPSGPAPPFDASLPEVEDLDRLAAAFERTRGERDFHLAAAPVESLERRLDEIGGNLGAALFQPAVRDRWAASCGRGIRPDARLRLRLQMPIEGRGGARLHATPWECLKLPGGDFAALDPSLSLVRTVVTRGRDTAPPRPRPLVVLVVASQAAGQPPLDLGSEIAALRRLESGDLHVEVLPEPSLETLRARLAGEPVHALHFLGHGGFDPVEKRGVVYLSRAGGGADAVSGALLASLLLPARTLRLVFLNACRTGAAAEGSPFAGVATAIIKTAGVPAVVAMQYPIPDRAAILFARQVYTRLAAGEGLDAAVTEGRRQLYHERSQAWVVPVLFSRQRGELFADEEKPRRWWLKSMVLVAAMTIGVLVGWGMLGPTREIDPITPSPNVSSLVQKDGPQPPVEEPIEDTGQDSPIVNPDLAQQVDGPKQAVEGPKTLVCGEPVHFAAADAVVSCKADQIQGESFLTLSLRYRGVTYGPRAVVGDGDLTFDRLPDVSLSVLGVDLEAGRLTVFPPAAAGR